MIYIFSKSHTCSTKSKHNAICHRIEGPKTATRGEVNESLKFLSKYLTAVPKSLSNTETKRRDVHDSDKWVDVPLQHNGTPQTSANHFRTEG
jgi:hypothetical protein